MSPEQKPRRGQLGNRLIKEALFSSDFAEDHHFREVRQAAALGHLSEGCDTQDPIRMEEAQTETMKKIDPVGENSTKVLRELERKKIKEKLQNRPAEIIWKNWNELNDFEISNTPKQLRNYAESLSKMGHLNKKYKGLGDLLDREAVAKILIGQAEEMEELGIFLELENPTWKLIIEKHLEDKASEFRMHKDADGYTENSDWKSFTQIAVKALHLFPPNITNVRNKLDELNKYRTWWHNQLEKMPSSKLINILKEGNIGGQKLTTKGEICLQGRASEKVFEETIANL